MASEIEKDKASQLWRGKWDSLEHAVIENRIMHRRNERLIFQPVCMNIESFQTHRRRLRSKIEADNEQDNNNQMVRAREIQKKCNDTKFERNSTTNCVYTFLLFIVNNKWNSNQEADEILFGRFKQ